MIGDPAILGSWREATGLGERLLAVAVRTFDYGRRVGVGVQVKTADGKIKFVSASSEAGGGTPRALENLKDKLMSKGLLP